eukprot:s1543_g29.t1
MLRPVFAPLPAPASPIVLEGTVWSEHTWRLTQDKIVTWCAGGLSWLVQVCQFLEVQQNRCESMPPHLFEVELTDPAISVRGKALVQPHVQLAISFVWGVETLKLAYLPLLPSQLLRFSQAAPPPGLQEHQKRG